MTVARAARVAMLGAALLALASACGGTSKSTRTSSDAVIRVDCAVRDARVVLNDRELGSVTQLRRGIALSPGRHRLEVKRRGYHTHYAELELTARERRVIVVELAERLP